MQNYMIQPEDFEVKGKEYMVCKLKPLWFKQAPQQWLLEFDQVTASLRKMLQINLCLKVSKSNFIILSCMLITFYFPVMMQHYSMRPRNSIEYHDMKDLNEASFVLGIEIHKDSFLGVSGCLRKYILFLILNNLTCIIFHLERFLLLKGDKFCKSQFLK